MACIDYLGWRFGAPDVETLRGFWHPAPPPSPAHVWSLKIARQIIQRILILRVMLIMLILILMIPLKAPDTKHLNMVPSCISIDQRLKQETPSARSSRGRLTARTYTIIL